MVSVGRDDSMFPAVSSTHNRRQFPVFIEIDISLSEPNLQLFLRLSQYNHTHTHKTVTLPSRKCSESSVIRPIILDYFLTLLSACLLYKV